MDRRTFAISSGRSAWHGGSRRGDVPVIYYSTFTVDSGTFTEVTSTVDGEQCRVIQCDVAGLVYFPWSTVGVEPSKSSYGTLEFYYLKPDARLQLFQPYSLLPELYNAASNDGYLWSCSAGESMRLFRFDDGSLVELYATSPGYETDGQWNHNKLTRAQDDTFTGYHAGSIISVVSGSNPVVDSTYSNLDFFVWYGGAGEKLALHTLDGRPVLKKQPGIV